MVFPQFNLSGMIKSIFPCSPQDHGTIQAWSWNVRYFTVPDEKTTTAIILKGRIPRLRTLNLLYPLKTLLKLSRVFLLFSSNIISVTHWPPCVITWVFVYWLILDIIGILHKELWSGNWGFHNGHAGKSCEWEKSMFWSNN